MRYSRFCNPKYLITKCSALFLLFLVFFLYYARIQSNDSIEVDVSGKKLIFELNRTTDVYELHGRPIIWQYWDQDHVPLYVRLLVNAMQCKNPEFQVILVHDSTIRQYSPDFFVSHEMFNILSPNHKSDVFRLAMLLKFGGVYADVDILALDKLKPIYDLLDTYDIVTPNWGTEKVSTCLLGPMKANLSIIQAWQNGQKEVVSKEKAKLASDGINPFARKYPFEWVELIGDTMAQLEGELAKNLTKYKGYDGYTTVGQLVRRGLADAWHESFHDHRGKFSPLNWSPVLYLHQGKMAKFIRNATRIDILLPKDATIYSGFVGCALLECAPEFDQVIKNHIWADISVNITELMQALKDFDKNICMTINNKRSVDIKSCVGRLIMK